MCKINLLRSGQLKQYLFWFAYAVLLCMVAAVVIDHLIR